MPLLDKQLAFDLIVGLQKRITEIFGYYYDSKQGFMWVVRKTEEAQTTVEQTVEESDRLAFTYGNGDPNDQNSVNLHSTTQGELKARNRDRGCNHLILDSAVISLLYATWNDKYRPELADALAIPLNGLSSDVFGDIRLIRNSIIHHDNIALPEIARCKILRYFDAGNKISFDQNQMDDLLFIALKDLDRIAQERLGLSTRFGTKLNAMGQQITS